MSGGWWQAKGRGKAIDNCYPQLVPCKGMKIWGSCFLVVLLSSTVVFAQDRDKLSRDDAKKLKNPVPYTKKSLTQGRNLFVRTCATCHGTDGKAELDVVADATNLTTPKLYKSGTSDGEIYRSIRDGAGANLTMPPFKSHFAKEDDTWHLVNFIRSLMPEDTRPALQPDDTTFNKKQ